MKTIWTLMILALSLALAESQAQAWVNAKLGAGVNWNFQSGGNNVLWGFFRNGQPPGPGCGEPAGGMGGFGQGCGFPGGPGGPGGFPMGPGCLPPGMLPPAGGPPGAGYFPGFISPGHIYGNQDFQYFGKNPYTQPNPNTEGTQQSAYPPQYRTSSYYPNTGYMYAPANGNAYYNPTSYSFGVNMGR
jgi:hypothetical protein